MMLARHARHALELGAEAARLRRLLASGATSTTQLDERVSLFAPHVEEGFERSAARSAHHSSVD